MKILQRLRRLFHQTPSSEPTPDRVLHLSIDGSSAACGFGDGLFWWTQEMSSVTCPLCKARAFNMLLHNKVTLR